MNYQHMRISNIIQRLYLFISSFFLFFFILPYARARATVAKKSNSQLSIDHMLPPRIFCRITHLRPTDRVNACTHLTWAQHCTALHSIWSNLYARASVQPLANRSIIKKTQNNWSEQDSNLQPRELSIIFNWQCTNFLCWSQWSEEIVWNTQCV